MESKGDLNKIVAGAVAGHTLDQIAAASGISRSTVQRRLSDPEVRRAIREEGARQRAESHARLRELYEPAVRRLRELVDHEDPAIALKAISLALTTSTKLATAVEVDVRLSALEGASGSEGDNGDLG
jgi:AcrR family transcriptional regulator